MRDDMRQMRCEGGPWDGRTIQLPDGASGVIPFSPGNPDTYCVEGDRLVWCPGPRHQEGGTE